MCLYQRLYKPWISLGLYVTSAWFHFSIIKHKSNTYLLKKQVQVCEQVCKFNPLCMSRFTRSKFPFKSKASASSAVCSLAFVSILLVNSQLKCTVKIFVQTGFAFLKICKNYFQILYKTIIEVDIFCMYLCLPNLSKWCTLFRHNIFKVL